MRRPRFSILSHPVSRARSLAGLTRVVVVALALTVRSVSAQIGVHITPADGPTGTQTTVGVDYCTGSEQYPMEFWMTVNGVDVSSSFTYYPSNLQWCAFKVMASGALTLPQGEVTFVAGLRAYYSDGADQYWETVYEATAHWTGVVMTAAPSISLSPHNGHNRSVVAGVANGFHTVASYTTPAYTSLDQPRAVTLLYSSGQVGDLHTVQADATNAAWNTPQKMSIRLRRPDGSYVTFTNGSTELFFVGVGYAATQRLAAEFSDTTLATGAYDYTVVVRSYFNGSPLDTTSPLRLLVLNERTSPYGAGWTVAGVPRLRFGPGDSLTSTDGAGAIQFWARSSCTGGGGTLACTYAPPNGEFDSLGYRAQGWTYSSDPYRRRLLTGTEVYFDNSGRATLVRDPFGNQTRYVWRDGERLDTIVDPAGSAIVFNYTSNRLSSIRDVPGNRLRYRVDRRGGDWRTGYDFAGHLVQDSTPAIIIDSAGTSYTRRLVTRYRSPDSWALIDPSSGLGTSGNPAPARADSGGIGTVTPPLGATRKMILDAYGEVLYALAPAQEAAAYTRNVHGQVTAAADSTGNRRYTWDGPRLLSDSNAVTHDALRYEWDTAHHVWTRRYGVGTAEVRTFVEPNGAVDSTRVGNEPATRFAYNARGQVTTVTDPRGHVTTSYLSSSGLLNTDSVTAGVHRATTRRDALGRVVRVRGTNGQTDSTVYDVLNRVVRTIGALGDTTRFAYVDSLHLTRVTDPLGNATEFQKNALGWDTAVVDPRGYANRYALDKGGRVVRWTNRRGQATTFAYDSLGRLMGRGLADGRITSFEYTATRMIATNSEGADTLRFAADTTYAIAVRTGSGGITTTVHRWFQSSVRVLTLDLSPFGGTTRYGQDSTGTLTAITPPPSAAIDSVFHNTDGLLTGTRRGAVTASLTSRPRHSLARLAYAPAGAQTAFGMEFVHDSLGRLVEARDSNRSRFERYGYDAAGRLVGFSRWQTSSACTATDTTSDLGALCTTGSSRLDTATFTYDLAGNPNASGDTVDTGNRLRAHAGYHFEYDNDGNVTRRYKPGVLDQYFYWNSANELDSVRSLYGGSMIVAFGYDAWGRRVRKSAYGASSTFYVWDGDHVVAEYCCGGTLLRQFTYFAGTDRPHSVFDGANRHYFATDGRANVIGLTDANGNVETRYRYTPFGQLAASTGAVANAILYSGREYDAETGLYYNRARYYDPQAARFTSEDPSGLAGGANPYAFGGNDPVNARDPSGRWCELRWSDRPQTYTLRLASSAAADDENRWPYLHCEDLGGASYSGVFNDYYGFGAWPTADPTGGRYAAPDIVERQTFHLDYTDFATGELHHFTLHEAVFIRLERPIEDKGRWGVLAYYTVRFGYATATTPGDEIYWINTIRIRSTLIEVRPGNYTGGFVQWGPAGGMFVHTR